MERGFDFSVALQHLNSGIRVRRSNWNKGTYIFLVNGSSFKVNRAPLNSYYDEGTEIIYSPHIDVHHADKQVMVWSPSHVDLLANDWVTY